MLKSYLNIAFRNFVKYRGFSIINIGGLAIGMTCFILIMLWVWDELSYDRFHENADNIYRIVIENPTKSVNTPGLLASAIKEEIPEVAETMRILKNPRVAVKYTNNLDGNENKVFYESNRFHVDSSIFNIFSFQLLKGNPKTALLNGIVITERMAKKYFGNEDPMGKILNINNWYDIEVTGVVQDIPSNSHIQFDFLERLDKIKRHWPNGFTWQNHIHRTYVKLEENTDVDVVEEKITAIYKKNIPPEWIAELRGVHLQPLKKVYLSNSIDGSGVNTLSSDIRYIYIFAAIGFIILFIACINFMNLAVVRSMNRSKEVGLRKVVGAGRIQIFKQFFGEGILLTVLAYFLAMMLLEIFIPSFNLLTGKSLSIDYLNIKLILFTLGMVFVTGILAGFYPSLILAQFNPIRMLKGASLLNGRLTSMNSRRVMVIVQLVCSIVLIICTIIIYWQLNYLQNKKLGFDKENIVCIPVKENIGKQYEIVKNELLKNPLILGVTIKECFPTTSLNQNLIDWEGKNTDEDVVMETTRVDVDFFKTLKIEFLEGRDFSKEFSTDLKQAFIINEAAKSEMGLKSTVGEKIKVGGREGEIIGVIKETNFKSLKFKTNSIVFFLADISDYEEMDLFGTVMIKINEKDKESSLKVIEKIYKKFNTNYPFEFSFLDQDYDRLYKSESRISSMFKNFAVLAIIILALGLFGLVSFMTEKRNKEIGVRKTMGASVLKVLFLLNKDFFMWVLIANLISWPIAWYAMSKWLQNYEYKINLSWWIFVMAGGIALIIALLTVSWQSWRTARRNPVEALRHE